MARISFRQGIIRTHATALQFTSGNSGILLDAQSAPVQLNLADGTADDYLWEEATKIDPAWTSLPTISPYWLYIDIDSISSERTFGTTTEQPLDQPNEPPSPAIDQHWFDTSSNQTVMKVWVGTKWLEKIRIFMGRVDGLTIFSFPTGSQVGLNDTVDSGQLLYDDENKTRPIKRFDRRGRGKFITTVSNIFNQFSNITGFKVSNALVEGKAIEPIPEYSAVAYRGERELGLAKNGTSTGADPGPYTAIGVATEDFTTSEVHTFTTSGYLTDDTFNWTEGAGTKLFVGPQGEISSTIPQSGSIQHIATVVDQFTILVNIQDIIIYGNA